MNRFRRCNGARGVPPMRAATRARYPTLRLPARTHLRYAISLTPMDRSGVRRSPSPSTAKTVRHPTRPTRASSCCSPPLGTTPATRTTSARRTRPKTRCTEPSMLRGPGSLPMAIMTQGQARMITAAELVGDLLGQVASLPGLPRLDLGLDALTWALPLEG